MPVRNDHSKMAILAVFIAVLIGLVYWPTLSHDFVNYDDPIYVYENPYLINPGLSPAGVGWAFSTFRNNNWHPLTWLSHMVDVRFFGLKPAGHHLVNLLFHVANALLLFILLRRGTGSIWRGVGVTLLFALHPLHVESVAWAAERKDLLSAFFFLLAIQLYLSYVRRKRGWLYLAVALAFACSLLSKPMAVTLPVALLLLDLWPLGRLMAVAKEYRKKAILQLAVEKLPLLLASVALSAITIRAQSSVIAPFNPSSLLVNAGNAIISYTKYLGKTFGPVDLTVFYPFISSAVTPTRVAAATLLFLLISGVLFRGRYRYPFLAWGWSWYLVTLFPAIGFIQVGEQAIADRYTYLPLIGIFVAMVFGVSFAATRFAVKNSIVVLVTLGIFAALTAATVNQIGYWRTSQTLFDHCLEVSGDTWLSHNNLGIALFEQGKLGEAIDHYQRAIALRSSTFVTYNNLGNAYSQLGRRPQAVAAYEKALELQPNNPEAHFNRGLTYFYMGDQSRADKDYQWLRSKNPAYAEKLLPLITRAREK